MAWRDSGGYVTFGFLGNGRIDDENARDERRWDKSLSETGTSENLVFHSINHT